MAHWTSRLSFDFGLWVVCFVLCCAPATLPGQQIARVLAADLPDAPGVSLSQQQGGTAESSANAASISGLVVDRRQDPVPAAQVTLVEEGRPESHGRSDDAGEFRLTNLAAGRYRLTVSASGFDSFVTPEITLRSGEAFTLPKIVLPLASADESVQVNATQVEIAQAQLHLEEKQRVLGIFPNFYSSYVWTAAPLDTRQKFDLAAHSILDPVIFVATGAVAGLEQNRNIFPAYGGGVGGYAQRYAADYGDELSARMFSSAIFPSLFHQDPRYFYKGSGTKRSRFLYAISRSVVTRGDDGRRQVNYSRILGAFAAGALSNAYRLGNDRSVGLTFRNSSIAIGGNAGDNVLREFLFKRFTTDVPEFANGKK